VPEVDRQPWVWRPQKETKDLSGNESKGERVIEERKKGLKGGPKQEVKKGLLK